MDCKRRSVNRTARLAIYVAFALTGVVTNLLGPIAPEIESAWRISDEQVGRLFFYQFIASTVTTIFVGRRLHRSATVGMAMTAIGVWLLGHGSAPAAAVAVAIYGAGLGLAITSINLLVATSATGNAVGSELALLNAFWIAGAAGFPLVHAFLPLVRGAALLNGIAILLAVACGVVALLFSDPHDAHASARRRPLQFDSILFALFFFLYVGCEVGLSGWLPTHADRASGSDIGSQAVLIFWIALLLGRLSTAALVQRVDHRKILLPAITVSLIATILLLLADSKMAILVAAGVAGAGFAPLFPVNLAMFTLAGHRAGWVLACSGIGAASFPWLMGAVSTQMNSIRFAVLIPTVSLACLAGIVMAYKRMVPGTSPEAIPTTDHAGLRTAGR